MGEATRRGLYVPLDVNYRDDPKIIGAGPDAELVYLRSLVLAKRLTDRDGHIHRAHLFGLCCDLDSVAHGEYVPDDIAKALIDSGLWVEDDDGWRIAAWLKHNPSAADLDESRSAEASRKAAWRQSQRDKGPRDEVSHGTARDATDSEEKRSEVKTEGKDSRGEPYASDFDALWKLYPRKVDRGHAFAQYQARRREGVTHTALLRAVENYAEASDGQDRQFVKHGATFLGKRGCWPEWVDEIPPDARPATLEELAEPAPPRVAVVYECTVGNPECRDGFIDVDGRAFECECRRNRAHA